MHTFKETRDVPPSIRLNVYMHVNVWWPYLLVCSMFILPMKIEDKSNHPCWDHPLNCRQIRAVRVNSVMHGTGYAH